MKTCHEVDAVMTAYVDGEIGGAEAAGVEAHLDECPPCRTRATAEQAARTVLRARAEGLTARAPAALRARCIAAAPPATGRAAVPAPGGWRHARGWVPLSMAATVLLAVGAVFVVGQNQRLGAAFAAQLALDHDRCFTHLDGGQDSVDREAAEGMLAQRHGLEVGLPPESADFDLLDVRRCQYDDGEMAHVLCTWRGEPVSLFLVPGRSDREQALEIVDHDAVIWSENRTAYALVAQQGPVDIDRVTAYVREHLVQ